MGERYLKCNGRENNKKLDVSGLGKIWSAKRVALKVEGSAILVRKTWILPYESNKMKDRDDGLIRTDCLCAYYKVLW